MSAGYLEQAIALFSVLTEAIRKRIMAKAERTSKCIIYCSIKFVLIQALAIKFDETLRVVL